MNPVCFFNSNTTWGGGEKWHYDISLRLQEKGCPVLVVTNTSSELFHRLNNHNIELRQFNLSNLSFLNIYKIIKISMMLKKYHIHTIILNLSSDVKVAGIAAKLAGVKKIIYRRGLARPVRNTALNRFLFTQIITDVITNSEETRKKILQNNPSLAQQEKIAVIYNGIDLHTYDQKELSCLYQKKPGEIVLGNAARLTAQKGQMCLIELAKILKAQGIKFRLLIAGKGQLATQLQQYAKTLCVEDEVIFLGFQENIKNFMETIDIFLLSSFYEGFGYVLVEAMASQKPVVAFKVSSNPEIVAHGQTGFLAEEGNVEDFARYVKELAQNETLRKTFGINARKRVAEKFEIQKVVEQVTQLIAD